MNNKSAASPRAEHSAHGDHPLTWGDKTLRRGQGAGHPAGTPTVRGVHSLVCVNMGHVMGTPGHGDGRH